MKAGRTRAAIVLGVAVLGIWMAGCDWGGDGEPGYPPPATVILEVRVEPNPVMAGDTTTFTCVTTDSLDTDLQFAWILDGKDGSANTDTNTYQWIAYDEAGIYSHRVNVSRHSDAGFEIVWENFDVEVIAPE